MKGATTVASSPAGTSAASVETVAGQLARFALELRFAELPGTVRHEAGRSLVNVIGCMLGGAHHAIIDIAVRGLVPHAGATVATLVGRAERADIFTATLLNTMAASVLTFDDTHAEALVHPSAPVAAALLALGEVQGVSGRDFMAAFVVGVEAMCRLSKALSVAPAVGRLNWAQSSVVGPVGVALAAGTLLGCDMDQLVAAQGIAVTQASGLRCGSGTMCTSYAPGAAAQSGLRAALLAHAGMIGPAAGIEGKDGLFEIFATQAHTAAAVDGLGVHFELLANTYKPYPCGAVIFPAIDAALEIAARPGFDVSAVVRICLAQHVRAHALTNRPQPRTTYEAQVSSQHWVAAALLSGQAGVAQVSVACIDDPRVAALRERIELVIDERLGNSAAHLEVAMTDGTILQSHIEHCTGSTQRPVSDAQLATKFLQLAGEVLPAARAANLLDRCASLGDSDALAALLPLLAGTAALRSMPS